MSYPLPTLVRRNKAGKRIIVKNYRGYAADENLFSRRWSFMWVTADRSMNYYTFHGKIMSAMARYRAQLKASIAGIRDIFSEEIPQKYIAFGGVIYFQDRARTGKYAKKYLDFILKRAGLVRGDIYYVTPDRPFKAKGVAPLWQAGIVDHQIFGGVTSSKKKWFSPNWQAVFGPYQRSDDYYKKFLSGKY